MSRRRSGFTLLELCVVMAIIIILGGVFLPTIAAFRGNTQVKAAADNVRARMAQARMKAMDEGQAYRLSLSTDGRRVRVSAESVELTGESAGTEPGSGAFQAEEEFAQNVTAQLVDDAAIDTNGWKRLATFLPDGTCREEFVRIVLREPGVAPVQLTLRGLTGVVSSETVVPGGP